MNAKSSLLALCGALCLLCACANAGAQGGSGDAQTTPPEQLVQYEIPDDINPYTGQKRAMDYPQGTRGVAFMINNVQPAWPVSGINSADLVYEMVTESGITRLMAVYRNYQTVPRVGPLRSARDQHVQVMLPLDTLFAHIGTSNTAQDYLEIYKYTNTKSLDGKYKNFYEIDAERRKEKGQEYCVYTDGAMFAKAAKQYGLDTALSQEPLPVFDFVRYTDQPRSLGGGAASTIYLRFSGYADASFTYDAKTNKYMKTQYDQPQTDMSDGGRQYGANNVFVLFANMEKYPDGVLTKVKFEEGQGAGVYFYGGAFQRVRWMKESPAMPLRIVDNEGNELDIKVNPGTSYIAVVDTDRIANCLIDGKTLEEAFAE